MDLDGTLAYYDTWRGVEHIGEPIPLMAQRVTNWLSEGKTVKIFTARVASTSPDYEQARQFVQAWTEKHFGVRLEVTAEKDFGTTEIWDDRARQVRENTGILVK